MSAGREFTILGAGNWGLTLATVLGKKGFPVRVWDRNFERALATELARESRDYLPGTKLPITVGVGTDPVTLLENSQTVIIALPVPSIRGVLDSLKAHIKPGVTLVSLSKGLEYETGYRASQIIEDALGTERRDAITVLSGPNLAPEIAAENPTSSVVAGASEDVCRAVQQDLSTPYFRVYTSKDVVGVELGGALKNIIAIACGIVDELGLGNNSRGALMTRGLAEITRLGAVLGANPLTFLGLSGVGDLIATCTSELSRNHTVGRLIGRGMSLDEIKAKMRMVAEGVNTTRSTLRIAQSRGVTMPITEEVANVLFNGKNARQAIRDLMVRELKREDEHLEKGLASA